MKKNYFLNLFLLLASFTLIVTSGVKAQAQCNPEVLHANLQNAIADLEAVDAELQQLQEDELEAKTNLAKAKKALSLAQQILAQKTLALKAKQNQLYTTNRKLNQLKAEYSASCSDPSTKHCKSLQSQIKSTQATINSIKAQLNALVVARNEAQQDVTHAIQTENSANYQLSLAKKALKSNLKRRTSYYKKVKSIQSQLNYCCKEGGDFDGDGFASVHCGGTDCNDQNATVYPGAIDLCGDGIDNDCDGEIDETVLDVTASECAVSYYGYGPQQGATISANATGGSGDYTYTWSNSMTGSSIDVDPTETTTYTVTVSDAASGCTGTATVTVYVIDVRCGKKNNKVMVCHSAGKKGKSKTLCIGVGGVADHLKHGDQLGSCGAENPCDNSAAFTTNTARQQLFELGDVQIYPNPARDQVTVSFEEETENYTVTIMDGNGRTIQQVSGEEQTLTIDLQDYVSGMYFILIQSQQDPIVKKFIIAD